MQVRIQVNFIVIFKHNTCIDICNFKVDANTCAHKIIYIYIDLQALTHEIDVNIYFRRH